MNVGVLSVPLTEESRSTNIARTLRLLDQAAQCDPTPDLMVIPPGCDYVRQLRNKMTASMAEMFQASLSAKAREWGVLIAAGLRRRTSHGTEDVSVLLDADGDERLVSRPGDHPEVVQDTLFGPLHVCCDSEDLVAASTVEDWPAAMLTLVLGRALVEGDTCAKDERKCEAIFRGTKGAALLVRGPNVREGRSGDVVCFASSLLGERWSLPDGFVTMVCVPTVGAGCASGVENG